MQYPSPSGGKRTNGGRCHQGGDHWLYPPHIRSLFSVFRAGVHNLRVASNLFSFTIVVVALATVAVLLTPMLEQVASVEEFGVDRRSWVVVQLDPGTSSFDTAVETELLLLPGVDEITESTNQEVGFVSPVEPSATDLDAYRTLGLDGSVNPTVVAGQALEISEIGKAYPRFAMPPETNRTFYENILPMITLIAVGLALILVVKLAFLAARTDRRREPGRLMAWVRHGAVVAFPVVLTVLGTSSLAAVLWPPVVRPLVSSLADGLIVSQPILDAGLEFGFYSLLAATVLTLIAMAAERPGKHTT